MVNQKDDLRVILESRFKDTNLANRISITGSKTDKTILNVSIYLKNNLSNNLLEDIRTSLNFRKRLNYIDLNLNNVAGLEKLISLEIKIL